MFKVQKNACSTCIYRKDSPLSIRKLERDIAGWTKGEFSGYRICHHAGDQDVCCRGFWNKHKDHFNLGRIAQRLGAVEFVNVDDLTKI